MRCEVSRQQKRAMDRALKSPDSQSSVEKDSTASGTKSSSKAVIITHSIQQDDVALLEKAIAVYRNKKSQW